jgi:hypothetical protein
MMDLLFWATTGILLSLGSLDGGICAGCLFDEMTSRRNVLASILLGAGVAMAPFEESASAFSQQSDDYAYRSRSPPSNAPMENTI